MKTIVVATDFSMAANNAVEYAKEMALAITADLFLLHVSSVPVSYSDMPVVIDIDELQKSAEDQMIAIKETLSWQTADKVYIETKVVIGSFFEELKNICEELIPYAVVMGSQGTSAAERTMFGGHTVYAMKHLMWPLITVPNNAHFSAVKKIGVACDFKEPVESFPIEEITRLVSDFNAKLCILNTGRKDVFNPDIVFKSELLRKQLSKLNPVFEFPSGNNTDQSIMDFAEQNEIDLLVVLPKRHGFLEMITHASHTKQFVLHCHVPVMALNTALVD